MNTYIDMRIMKLGADLSAQLSPSLAARLSLTAGGSGFATRRASARSDNAAPLA